VTATAGGPTLRRRWRRFVLRTQGRLDGEAADRILPWSLGVALFVVLAALSAAAVRAIDGGSGLAPWIQAAWRREHGGAGLPVGGVDPATGTLSLAAEPLLLLARWVPPEAVFTLVQALAIGLGLVPLWRLARHEAHLRVGATGVIVAAYALAPTLHRTNLSSFHPEAIALPALLGAYLHGRQGHWKRYALLVALVLAARADLGLSVAALGGLLALGDHKRAGTITAAVGVAWTSLGLLLVDPQLPETALTPAGEFVARSTGPLAVVPQLVVDPLGQLRELFTEPSIGFLVVVLAPLLFLPLVAPRRFAAALPCLALAMIADTAVQEVAQRGVINLSPAASHIAPAMAFVFIALVFALERIGEVSVTRVNVDRRVLLALLAGCSLLFLAESPSSPYRSPWAWGSRDALDGARLEAADLIAPDAAVAVSPQATALVAARAEVVELPPAPADLRRSTIGAIADDSDAVLLDTTGDDPATGRPFWTTDDARRVTEQFADEGFRILYRAQGVYLLVASDQALDASG
jgi:hypothetical protein